MSRMTSLRDASRPSSRLVPIPSGLDRRAVPEVRWALAAVVAVSIAQILFLFVGCDWELCADEAEYWAWSRRLDWSYYAKGPLIAVLIRLGTALFGDLSLMTTGTLMPAVRLPAVILGGLTAWGVFRLSQLACGGARAGLIAVLLLPAVPIFRIGGLLATIDTPLLCCWTWAAVWTYRAVVQGRGVGWAVAGLLGTAGVLAKYTMLTFPASVGLFLILSPPHRRQLVRPGFWVMTALHLSGMVPIVAWNASHGWVGAGQMAERVGLTSHWDWTRLRALLDFLGCEVAVWGGVWWVVGVLALRGAVVVASRGAEPDVLTPGGRTVIRHGGADRAGFVYLLCLWGVIWWACIAVSFLGETEANWGAPGYVAVLALSGWWLGCGPFRRWSLESVALVLFWFLGMIGMTALQHTEWLYPALGRFVPPPTDRWPAPLKDLDPTNRMRGHRPLIPEIERRLSALRSEGLDPFILAPTPYLASELTFYLPGHPEVYCLAFSWTPERPVNQHDLWHPNPRFDLATFRGRPAVIIEDAHFRPNYAESLVRHGWFARSDPPTRLLIRERGQLISAWDVSIDRDFLGLDPSSISRLQARHRGDRR